MRLHLFSGFENKKLGITLDMELGHLYDWRGDIVVLEREATRVGMKPHWLQETDGFWHFDLWGKPLAKAKELFQIVDDTEFAQDVERLRVVRTAGHPDPSTPSTSH